MKLKIAFSLLVSGLLIYGVVFWIHQRNYISNGYLIYDELEKDWSMAQTKPTIDRQLFMSENPNNQDGFHNYTILVGFFDKYIAKDKILQVKAKVPLSNFYEPINIQVDDKSTFFCAPKNITDSKTGRVLETKDVVFAVRNGQELSTHLEESISIDKFVDKANLDTYLLIQLETNYSYSEQNILSKIIAVGICE